MRQGSSRVHAQQGDGCALGALALVDADPVICPPRVVADVESRSAAKSLFLECASLGSLFAGFEERQSASREMPFCSDQSRVRQQLLVAPIASKKSPPQAKQVLSSFVVQSPQTQLAQQLQLTASARTVNRKFVAINPILEQLAPLQASVEGTQLPPLLELFVNDLQVSLMREQIFEIKSRRIGRFSAEFARAMQVAKRRPLLASCE